MTAATQPSSQHALFTDEIIREVGLVVIRWNAVEMYAQFVAGHILGVSIETSNMLFNSSSVPFQAEVFSAIVKERVSDPVLAKELLSAAKKMQDLSNFRNTVVHGRWVSESRGGPLTFVIKKGGAKALSRDDLRSKSNEIRILGDRLLNHLLAMMR